MKTAGGMDMKKAVASDGAIFHGRAAVPLHPAEGTLPVGRRANPVEGTGEGPVLSSSSPGLPGMP
jgi:hypothetical protein